MVRITCKHVAEAGAPSGDLAVSIVHLRVLHGAPPSAESRREWIECEAFLCGICTVAIRASLGAMARPASAEGN